MKSQYYNLPKDIKKVIIRWGLGLLQPIRLILDKQQRNRLKANVCFSYSVHSDSLFELIAVVMNMAIWHTKHALQVASTDTITMEEAKEVHRSLKIAAGMFLHIKEHLITRLPASPDKGVDTDSRVVEAYAQQSQAEAQEGWFPFQPGMRFSFFVKIQLPLGEL